MSMHNNNSNNKSTHGAMLACTKSETIKMEEYSYQKRACCGMPSMLWHTMWHLFAFIKFILERVLEYIRSKTKNIQNPKSFHHLYIHISISTYQMTHNLYLKGISEY